MRLALIDDSHLSARSPECVANWHAAARAIRRLGVERTVHLGDITLDAQTHRSELAFVADLVRRWPTQMHCVPGNHDLGDGSGESPLDADRLDAYVQVFGPDRWVVRCGSWMLLGINAQLLGSDTAQERDQWDWLEHQVRSLTAGTSTALFTHRPVRRPNAAEHGRGGRYVQDAAAQRLLHGALAPTLRLVVSGHTHQYLDTCADGIRHLWMPSSAFVLPDSMQARVGEKVVGVGVLDLGDDAARFDLWCPDGMVRHNLSTLAFFRSHAPGAE
jgi:3',5'-cyclic AMP phosphodiesterase CpdA